MKKPATLYFIRIAGDFGRKLVGLRGLERLFNQAPLRACVLKVCFVLCWLLLARNVRIYGIKTRKNRQRILQHSRG